MATEILTSLSRRAAGLLKDRVTHLTLPQECAKFGLPESALNDVGSISERIVTRFAGLQDREIANVVEIIGREYGDFDLEEEAIKYRENTDPCITEITRRDVSRCFEDLSLNGDRGLFDMLRQVWPIDAMSLSWDFESTLVKDIEQHMLRNDDWSVEQLFEHLGAFTCSCKRFLATLEISLHPLSRRGDPQIALAERLNRILAHDGYQLSVAGHESGYPVYRASLTRSGVAGTPKNLIFASNGSKPEIGFQDAINNDIVILSHGESCLVYDRPISRDGLRWVELVQWWREIRCSPTMSEEEVRKELGQRLKVSLQSKGEENLFVAYFRLMRSNFGDALPALVPQVYLHYDPAIVAQLRHRQSFPRQRMDFLLLLPQDARVVIEVDGSQHFSRDGKPSLSAYAEMVCADRDLRLLGYELYRFGANELVGPGVDELLQSFFCRLFERHRVTP